MLKNKLIVNFKIAFDVTNNSLLYSLDYLSCALITKILKDESHSIPDGSAYIVAMLTYPLDMDECIIV